MVYLKCGPLHSSLYVTLKTIIMTRSSPDATPKLLWLGAGLARGVLDLGRDMVFTPGMWLWNVTHSEGNASLGNDVETAGGLGDGRVVNDSWNQILEQYYFGFHISITNYLQTFIKVYLTSFLMMQWRCYLFTVCHFDVFICITFTCYCCLVTKLTHWRSSDTQ